LTQFSGFVCALNSKIVNKASSPDVIAGNAHEDATGIPYEKLDLILLAPEKGWDNNTVAAALKVGTEKVEYVPNLALRSEHMRQLYTPPRSLC
jgi:NH3-dependent NAD+ synthetase